MTRKDFIVLTFTLIGGAATVAACGTSNEVPIDGGITGLGGRGGSGGAGGAGGGAGAGGSGGAGGAGGATDAGTADTGTAACTDPLPESQVADLLMHVHTVTVPASTLNATSNQTITTGIAAAPGGVSHNHTITLTPANLATIKGGGQVTVASSISQGHLHGFVVSCH